MDYQKILKFWFSEIEPELWFKKDEDFDADLRQRFGAFWQAASKGELAHWRQNIEGRLAEIYSGIYPALFPAMVWHWCWHKKQSGVVKRISYQIRSVVFSIYPLCIQNPH